MSELCGTLSVSVYISVHLAEETLTGTKLFFKNPSTDFLKIDGIFVLHYSPKFEAGKNDIKYGGILASIDITVTGKGCHGVPSGIVFDSILVASSIVQNLQYIVSREKEPPDNAVVSICSVHDGNAFNIVLNEVTLNGTVRTVNKKGRDNIEQSIKRNR